MMRRKSNNNILLNWLPILIINQTIGNPAPVEGIGMINTPALMNCTTQSSFSCVCKALALNQRNSDFWWKASSCPWKTSSFPEIQINHRTSKATRNHNLCEKLSIKEELRIILNKTSNQLIQDLLDTYHVPFLHPAQYEFPLAYSRVLVG